jgi:2-iminobutanoate/2-iminopropanoate deaminase
MIGIDPDTGEVISGGIQAETRQVMENLGNILKAGGSSLSKVLKTTVFMTDMDEFKEMNQVYAEYFPSDPPARSTLQVAGLPGGARIMIDTVAVIGEAFGD